MKRIIAATGVLGLALALGACAEEDTTDETTTAEMTTEETTAEETATEEETTTEDTATEDTATEEEETAAEDTAAAEAEGDIVETATAAGSFNTLTEAIDAAGLTETLQGEGPFTVFAPTDEAFDALPEGTLDELLADPTGDLAQILQYHVVEGEFMAADVLELDGQTVPTLQGGELTVEVDGENVSLVDAAGNSVNVTDTDVPATNGVIHVLDGVLSPTA